MAQSVSNDALWEKLSEVDKKLEKLSEMQETSNLDNEQTITKSDFQKEKDEILSKLERYIQGLGTHCDSHFKVIHKNIEQLEKDTVGVYNILSCMSAILKEPQEPSARNSDDKKSYLNFKLFKLRKSSLVIAILGILVFIMTLFCMKQQNDYVLLLDEYYRQSIESIGTGGGR
ncbi:hypothetical protein [Massilibacteroides sp.]|uniref:hypothetical protein n=1 Tax=Massilibacteroides sp. TaxID=2034766 RepID=UPI00262918F2|nr:hypothetical protein [Massilibacteroides sp.]MDD4516663.1 hypothetical protein [Massilibacteroides sp.]